jgi:hypothetical protein
MEVATGINETNRVSRNKGSIGGRDGKLKLGEKI